MKRAPGLLSLSVKVLPIMFNSSACAVLDSDSTLYGYGHCMKLLVSSCILTPKRIMGQYLAALQSQAVSPAF